VSRVYFHSPSGDAELLGSERAMAAVLIEDLAAGIVTPHIGHQRDRMLELIPAGHYLRAVPVDHPSWPLTFGTAWRTDLDLDWQGRPLAAWTFSLNTALTLGNDQVRFLARLHGQCEIHGWVEGQHRTWLAGIIDRGREVGLYRAGAGWEAVAALLRSRNDEPVVMSYSVCDAFPNAHASDWLPPWPTGKPQDWDALSEAEQDEREARTEAWYDLDGEEQWARGMRWLRAEPGMKQLEPIGWAEFRFGHGLSVFDLIAPDRDARVAAALGVEPVEEEVTGR
jgi:hypothetical protein